MPSVLVFWEAIPCEELANTVKTKAITAATPFVKSRACDTSLSTRLPRDAGVPDFLLIAYGYAIPLSCRKFDLMSTMGCADALMLE